MPCYQVRTTTLDAPAANLDVMSRALEALGLRVMSKNTERRAVYFEGGKWQDGVLTCRYELGFDSNALRREYSKQAIKTAAKKNGWQLRFTQQGQAIVTRRRYS